jgi:hypothetical protein
MIGLDWVGHRILGGVGYTFGIVERINRSGSNTGSHNESFDAESAGELGVSNAIFIGLDIPLVPEEAERLVGHLNDEQVKVGVGW